MWPGIGYIRRPEYNPSVREKKYSRTLIIVPFWGRAKVGQIGIRDEIKSSGKNSILNSYQTGWSKSGPITKVVRLSGVVTFQGSTVSFGLTKTTVLS